MWHDDERSSTALVEEAATGGHPPLGVGGHELACGEPLVELEEQGVPGRGELGVAVDAVVGERT